MQSNKDNPLILSLFMKYKRFIFSTYAMNKAGTSVVSLAIKYHLIKWTNLRWIYIFIAYQWWPGNRLFWIEALIKYIPGSTTFKGLKLVSYHQKFETSWKPFWKVKDKPKESKYHGKGDLKLSQAYIAHCFQIFGYTGRIDSEL